MSDYVVNSSQSWIYVIYGVYRLNLTIAKGKVLATNYHILVVDDDVSICSLLRLFFSRSGYTVSEAHDGIDGLEIARQYQPDLIMSDTHMPRMGGIEMAEALRADPHFVAIPIILLTGSVDISVVRNMTMHFDAVIAKPFQFAQLNQTVTALLG
ncbi:MAG: hypothetical protein GFH27_549357n23 [Chloroflexi bacterium AL-W]|nr:hypothetical protein [Chloroflexi bacterium AL-N1]NOK70660.1 hypothetical protein [Chloroflexi bacterium AL-N10]NOK78479.1 hypothetical protein [Chloroflexi bacterium AL-N5]NOK85563.1 hypothetical protein [Chloroflexi bacterium AL-W]NOK92477.1 hypothetical protein [Chloroflexi bacterium AL-N15]